MDLPFDPVFPLLGIYLKEPKTLRTPEGASVGHKHPYVHCNIIYNCQDMEAAQVSIGRQVDKTTMGIHTMEYYSAVIKKKILPLVTVRMDLEKIMLSEISQSE